MHAARWSLPLNRVGRGSVETCDTLLHLRGPHNLNDFGCCCSVFNVGVKRFRCAEVLFLTKFHELPDSAIITVGVNTLLLFLQQFLEFQDSNIFIVDAKRFRCKDVFFQPRKHCVTDTLGRFSCDALLRLFVVKKLQCDLCASFFNPVMATVADVVPLSLS